MAKTKRRRVSQRDLKVLKNFKKLGLGSVQDINETFNYPDSYEIVNKLHRMNLLKVDRGYRDPHYKLNAKGKEYLKSLKK